MIWLNFYLVQSPEGSGRVRFLGRGARDRDHLGPEPWLQKSGVRLRTVRIEGLRGLGWSRSVKAAEEESRGNEEEETMS